MPIDRRMMLLIFGLSLIIAAWLWSSRQHFEPAPPIPAPVAEKKFEVLIAKQAIEPGTLLTADKIEWVSSNTIAPQSNSMKREQGSEGENPYLTRLVVKPIAKGEALLGEQFAGADTTNYIAQQLQPGKRAYAISIDTKGSATAGNFILPNDYVDIIRSYNSNMGLQSETILTNIRVLAVGQTIHGDALTTAGDTATVEVDIHDAEILATAQRTGQISLALRNPNESGANEAQSGRILVLRPVAVGEKAP